MKEEPYKDRETVIVEMQNTMRKYEIGLEDLFPDVFDRIQFLEEWKSKTHKLPSTTTKRPI